MSDHNQPNLNIYPDELLPMFRQWLRATYIPGQFLVMSATMLHSRRVQHGGEGDRP